MGTATDRPPTPSGRTNDELSDDPLRQRDFFPFLVHELRNLVAPLSNSVQLMRLRAGADPELQPAIQIMDKQIKSLGRAFEKLSTAERLSRDGFTLTLKSVQLAHILDPAIQVVQPLIDGRRQHLHVAQPPSAVYLEGNADYLILVLGDLLENASQFTPDEGEIWVEAIVSDAQVRICVRDNGVGIRPESLSQLFNPFATETRSRHTGKHGLGLSLMIARRIIESHNGRISVSSSGQDQGSEFVIYLPLRGNEGHVSAPDPEIPPAAVSGILSTQSLPMPQRFLVVDDNDAVRASLCSIAQEMGYEVKGAADGAQALELAREWMPGFVFLDINLPKLNGYQVARTLRSQFPASRMMLVMMSGDSLNETILREAREAGFDRCVDKTRTHEVFAELSANSRSHAGPSGRQNTLLPSS